MAELISSGPIWPVITHLGTASIVLPLVLIAAIALWTCGQRAALRNWLLALAVAAGIALLSKVMFIGWGMGIAAIDFTGLSGHALLATAVLPILFAWLWAPLRGPFNRAGAVLGLLLGALVAVSRVVLGAHSVSEALLGWLAGFMVSWVALNSLSDPTHRPWLTRLSILLLALALIGDISTYLPTHHWETALALRLSGRSKPFTRQHLHLEAQGLTVSLPAPRNSPR
ncbi:MAG: phosphatase PAP2 family protein [Azonexus sp.]